AFYSAKQNAPFALNRSQNAFPEKVCKSVRFFAQVREMTFTDWQSEAVSKPDWGVGMQVSRWGDLQWKFCPPVSAFFCFFSHVQYNAKAKLPL
ncbi:MAG: hypothetical protein WCJ47_10995, partial [Methanomicrobiales archaeon]